ARARKRPDARSPGSPQLTPVRGPHERGGAERRPRRLLPREVHDAHRADVVASQGMIDERDAVALSRDAWIRDPAARLVEDLPDGEFQAIAARDLPDHGQALAVGRPVRFLDVLEDLAGSGAVERDLRERSRALPSGRVMTPEREREVPSLR